MGLVRGYLDFIAEQQMQEDPHQREVMQKLEDVAQSLQQRPAGIWRALGSRLWGMPRWPTVKGLYIWGSVGLGKTQLMDYFFRHIPLQEKRRVHFHRFMREVHEALARRQGELNPLVNLGRSIARKVRLLCFDEFVVNDIADAMLLGGLLGSLFSQGVTLIATSNTAPGDLYRNGLQRPLFQPAIDLIEAHCQVVAMAGGVDYRLRTLSQAALYHSPLDEAAQTFMAQRFMAMAHEAGQREATLEIAGRSIPCEVLASNVVWFDFEKLCHVPRCQRDYLEIAQCFSTVLLSNVPALSDKHENALRNFIHLIDVFYDARVKLILSAAVSVHELYPAGRHAAEFSRTRSRLLEMQSQHYLGQAHRLATVGARAEDFEA